MGRFSSGPPVLRLFRGETARVVIGSFCAIADEVEFMPGGGHHYPKRVTTFSPDQIDPDRYVYEPGEPKGDIVVGHDVWFGYGAMVLSGVHIGNGAVIGARAVVAGDVRPYAIVVGNPAREVGRRFSDEQIEALGRIRWWDWPLEKIQASLPLLASERVDEFIAAHDPGSGGSPAEYRGREGVDATESRAGSS
jgi:acetyltransferase-like isoleucine patch superfamily enzyme